MKKIFLLFFTVIMIFATSCKKDQSEDNDNSVIVDSYGRQLVLHGLNTSSNAKWVDGRQPWISEANVDKEANEFGFNFVRYLIFWDAIEPEKGQFNEKYLDEVEKRVNWYTSQGVHVMLDMHQDLYSYFLAPGTGDGAPLWACRTNGAKSLPFPPETPWAVYYIDPPIVNSFTNFWLYTDHKDLQDHYILSWKKVAEKFNNNPMVIGYDIINEPHGPDLYKSFISGEFEKVWLTDFYKRVILEIRDVSPNKYLFFEPQAGLITVGEPSTLGKIKDTRTENRLVYAPHCYVMGEDPGGNYGNRSINNLKKWFKRRDEEAKFHGKIPVLAGEFGLSPNQIGYNLYLNDFFKMMDERAWHWAYWSNDQGGWSPFNADLGETPIAQYLLRTYPKATSGRIITFNFDPANKDFSMNFINNPTIIEPTEIFVPKRFYPNGYNMIVQGTNDYTTSYDEKTQVLSLKSNSKANIKIEISAK
jgi:endoglycosylceramidase